MSITVQPVYLMKKGEVNQKIEINKMLSAGGFSGTLPYLIRFYLEKLT
jgi:cytoskeletal protein CcmA (bactofilin family)